ncbi:hypothetical protein [Nocardia fluminea]|uniref:hypothetical protein n=1 Tax=Nocardia fluminea TaxID=134984 RepID=UPI0033F39F4A
MEQAVDVPPVFERNLVSDTLVQHRHDPAELVHIELRQATEEISAAHLLDDTQQLAEVV